MLLGHSVAEQRSTNSEAMRVAAQKKSNINHLKNAYYKKRLNINTLRAFSNVKNESAFQLKTFGER